MAPIPEDMVPGAGRVDRRTDTREPGVLDVQHTFAESRSSGGSAVVLGRGLSLSIFTADLFATGDDDANRAAVAAVGRDDLDQVGLALYTDRKVVDVVLKGARLHP
ncbi:DUF2000 family protein [Nocardia sp. NPDC003963]